jgi:hypothetical protein
VGFIGETCFLERNLLPRDTGEWWRRIESAARQNMFQW